MTKLGKIGEYLIDGSVKVSFPKFICDHEWMERNQVNGRTKFCMAGYTVKISSQTVQYVAKYQYANIKHKIQTYDTVEVWSIIQFYIIRNHSATEIHKKLCAVYSWLMHCGPYTAHNFPCISFTLQFRTV